MIAEELKKNQFPTYNDFRREYKRLKQMEYRTRKRGCPPRSWRHTEDVMNELVKLEGHCKFCGMLLESEYHKKHPLVGCLKYNK